MGGRTRVSGILKRRRDQSQRRRTSRANSAFPYSYTPPLHGVEPCGLPGPDGARVGGLARCGAIGGPVLASGLGFRSVSVRELTKVATLLVSTGTICYLADPKKIVTLLVVRHYFFF